MAAAVLVAATAARLARLQPPVMAASAQPALVGAFHIDEVDGANDADRLAAEARAAGLDFVVTTSRGRPWPRPRQLGDVTILSLPERSGAGGRVIALGRSPAADAVAVVAHPFDPLLAWRGSEADFAAAPAGVEIAHVGSTARRLAQRPLPWRLGLIAGLAAVNPALARAQLVERDPRALALWDRLPAGALALCGSGAQAWLPRAPTLATWQLVVEGAPRPPAARAAWLTQALVAGDFLCAAAVAGRHPATSLRAYPAAAGGPPRASVAQALVLAVPPVDRGAACGELLRDGLVVAEACGEDVVLLTPPPGVYRGEVTMELPGPLLGSRRVPVVYTQRLDLAP